MRAGQVEEQGSQGVNCTDASRPPHRLSSVQLADAVAALLLAPLPVQTPKRMPLLAMQGSYLSLLSLLSLPLSLLSLPPPPR